MRWNIYRGTKLVAKTLYAEDALMLVVAVGLLGEDIRIKKEGRVALRISTQLQLEEVAESYDRAYDVMCANLRASDAKSRAAYAKRWPQAVVR